MQPLAPLLEMVVVDLSELRLIGQVAVADPAEIGTQRQTQRVSAGSRIKRRNRRSVAGNDLQQFPHAQPPEVADSQSADDLADFFAVEFLMIERSDGVKHL